MLLRRPQRVEPSPADKENAAEFFGGIAAESLALPREGSAANCSPTDRAVIRSAQ